MLSVSAGRRIWLCTQPTDMRRSFDGLSALDRNHLGEDPTLCVQDKYAAADRKQVAKRLTAR